MKKTLTVEVVAKSPSKAYKAAKDRVERDLYSIHNSWPDLDSLKMKIYCSAVEWNRYDYTDDLDITWTIECVVEYSVE